ncbi:hypothetical protein BCR34DRAFT_625433 [Clohesyomyces aquaticus]|uniref:Uncharacterized protein n=1 Tax=Clohesyomyces aquaticus TaxID=1231657 RepID=A0A1Y1ZJ30_9PLEO|nr:hypothetical protein BCR34DRAFT_625433 [Clohesyomyces aquaticus]
MARFQPYLYNDSRNSVSEFNPKAVTMASQQPPPAKPKQEGPLINFNRHPDSYLILPYGKTNAKPMNPRHKTAIKVTRWIQLLFRLLTLCGAIGLLLCGIFIRGAQATEGYIMRIPPGIDIVFCLYGVYHLCRAAKARPAGSSASYHFFALGMDAGFIPFCVFTAMLALRNYNEQAGTDGRWRTFFPTDEETNKVLQVSWLTATTVGGLHCASMSLDLYLLLIFRKISGLPPDMNPLEENLTSRRKSNKHKHKNSSISAMTPLTADDTRFSAQSGATTVVGSRHSQGDPLMGEKDIPYPQVNKMAFMHTRTNSDMAYSPHTPKSAQQSRHSLYSGQNSARQSRADLNRREDLHRVEDSDDNETLAQRKAMLAEKAIKRSSRPNSMVSSKQDYYTPPSTADKHRSTGDLSLAESRGSLQNDNWFVHGEVGDEPEPEPEPVRRYSPVKMPMFPSKTQTQGYNAVPMDFDVSDDEYESPMMPQPLRMNPPTPPPATMVDEPKSTPPQPGKLQRTLTTMSISTDATFSRSLSRASTPKSRYYGDLKAATNGVKTGGFSPANSPGASPTKNSFAPNGLPSAAKSYTTNSPITNKYAKNSPISLDKKNYASIRRTGEANYSPVKNQSPRVVSRSGVDYVGDYSFDNDGSDLGTPGRRRDVSGKIAEEGRGGVANLAERWGGMRNGGLTYRKVSGVA